MAPPETHINAVMQKRVYCIMKEEKSGEGGETFLERKKKEAKKKTRERDKGMTKIQQRSFCAERENNHSSKTARLEKVT
jgi:hypothetical protein